VTTAIPRFIHVAGIQDTHSFAVEQVNNDNPPLIPAVIDAVDVTV
jgi:hypothetical protein